MKHSFNRIRQIRAVIKKYGLTDLLESLSLSNSARLAIRLLFGKSKASHDTHSCPKRVRLALEELGPVFIKLGQTLSTRPDLLNEAYATQLSKLQDQVPPFSNQQALKIIQDTFAEDLDTVFTHIEETPLASASIAQVHAAQLQKDKALVGKSGQPQTEVIIKLLRPGIHAIIESDLKVLYTLGRFLDKHWSRAKQFKPLEIIKEYEAVIHNELNFQHEAANCSQMRANFENSDLIYVPQIYWDYTHQHLLVMERVYGTPVRDTKHLADNHVDLKQLANDGVEVFFKQAFEDNFFHADMHPGNIFVDDQGHWIAIDFGIMGTLNDEDKQYLAEMFLGFFNRDYRAIAATHVRAGWIPQGTKLEEFETAIRMVCEPNFAKPINQISFGKVLFQLFQTIRRFEIPVQPQLVLLYKTILNIEGLGRQLYPELNLWDSAKPFLEKWMKQQLSPQTLLQDFKHDWPRWRGIIRQLPDHLEKTLSEQSRTKQTTNEQIKSEKMTWHPSFILLVISVITAFLHHYKIITNFPLIEHSLWFSLVAIIWHILSKRMP